MDLNEFSTKAKAMDGRHRRCMTCSLNEYQLSEVHAARDAESPTSFEIISRWLKEDQGVTIHPNTIRNHFINKHND